MTTPIYTAVAYEAGRAAELDAIFEGTRPGFTYLRHGHPTAAALEEAVARLEGGAGAVAFASGMAALYAACLAADLRRDDVIVAGRDLYGATRTLFRDIFFQLGVTPRYGDACAPEAFAALIAHHRPRVVFVEAMSNPLLRVPDLPRIVQCAREVHATVIVDATFVTPRMMKPLALGADLVVHSSTKFLNGHGDALGGIVVARDAQSLARLRHVARITGGVLGPFDAFLTLRGLKTLGLRLVRQCASARRIAAWLADQPAVARVHYPGLPSHPDHGVAARLFADDLFGAVVSFELNQGTRDRVFRFMDALCLCATAPTVGDIYSQLLYPAISSHRDLTPQQRAELGIGDGLVRLSVGIEDLDDLVADLARALAAAQE
jgi:cystathionine beta-lyase/cystathionine gamma-synthase